MEHNAIDRLRETLEGLPDSDRHVANDALNEIRDTLVDLLFLSRGEQLQDQLSTKEQENERLRDQLVKEREALNEIADKRREELKEKGRELDTLDLQAKERAIKAHEFEEENEKLQEEIKKLNEEIESLVPGKFPIYVVYYDFYDTMELEYVGTDYTVARKIFEKSNLHIFKKYDGKGNLLDSRSWTKGEEVLNTSLNVTNKGEKPLLAKKKKKE